MEGSFGKCVVLGGSGMGGKALCRLLRERSPPVVVTAPSHAQLDLLSQRDVERFLRDEQPDTLFVLAARVGGIMAEERAPGEFMHQNLAIATNVLHAAHVANVKRLLFVSSASVYPEHCSQPISEDALFVSGLPRVHQYYAIAKIAAMKLLESYRRQYGHRWICAVPTNLYGPGDSLDEKNSNVIAGLMTRMHSAKTQQVSSVTVRGTGKITRDFLYVDDFARACITMMESYDGDSPLNVGSGSEVSVQSIALAIRDVVGFGGEIVNDTSFPDGHPRRVLNVEKLMSLGWKPQVSTAEGLKRMYEWFKEAAK